LLRSINARSMYSKFHILSSILTNKLVIIDYCSSPSVATMCCLCNWISTTWAPTPTSRHISTIIDKWKLITIVVSSGIRHS
jgi:hypothetical protein